MPSSKAPRGRYAPTPSGLLHVGNARTALVGWLSIRAQGGVFVWRLEDLDGPRCVAGMAEAAEDDLRWLGLDWDEGGALGGPYGPYVQSQRVDRYERALDALEAAGRLFPCRRTRADLQRIASAPHGSEGGAPYPAAWRPCEVAPGWLRELRAAAQPDAAIRFRVDDEVTRFDDLVHGPYAENVAREVGDFVLKRRDGVWAYQLAVVVDDLEMAIDEVVRGRDLLESTARQLQLIDALGGRQPRYAHLPLVLNAEGEKLSKRDSGLTVRSLRVAGIAPESLVGYLAWSLGLRPGAAPCTAASLIGDFAWKRITRADWPLPVDLAALLRSP
jgi:glutamyl-tRNA synthetase